MDQVQEDLAAEVHHLGAALSAVHARLLAKVVEADRQRIWETEGSSSLSGWLVARLGVSHQTAASWADTAQRLENLPALAAEFSEGRTSYDQVRTACRYAQPDSDQEVAEEAGGLSVEQLRRRARQAARMDLRDVREAFLDRSLRWWWDEHRPLLHLRGELSDHDGAVVVKALTRIAYNTPPEARSGLYEPFDARSADALVQLASQSLGADQDPDRATLVVHVDAAAFEENDRVAEVEDGPVIAVQVARRLACDARSQPVIDDLRGLPVGIGRTSRTVPAWLARQIRHRDGGCRFPGCEKTRWVHIHHLVHWVDGGPTDLDNLITLCGYHHRLVHEHGWSIKGDPNQDVMWLTPHGTPYIPRPPDIPPENRRKLFEYAIEHTWTPIRGSAHTDTS